MFHTPAQVREAGPDDVDDLLDVWAVRASERVLAPPARSDALASLARIAADPDQRVLVAVVEDRVAGAVHLVRGPVSPVHSDSAVYVLHLQVIDEFRRHGIGRSFMEAAVTWAEEKDSSHVVAAASAGSRNANRFMARLGLVPTAMIRAAPVASMRARLPLDPPAVARVGTRSHRNVGQVIVQRRSLRRARDRSS